MNFRPISRDAYFVLINVCSLESVIWFVITETTYFWVKIFLRM